MISQGEFLITQLVWATFVAGVLFVLRVFSPDTFFLVTFIGFLCTVALTAPTQTQPPWRRRLKWVITAGVIVFVFIVVRRIMAAA